MISPVAKAKVVGITAGSGTTPPRDGSGSNFAVLFYSFNNAGDYPLITDNYGNNLNFNTSRENAGSPAAASEMRFTKEFVSGPNHTFTIGPSGTYPGGLIAASLYVQMFSGVEPGSNLDPSFFSAPWYNDGGNNDNNVTAIGCNTGASGGANGQLICFGWANQDALDATVVTATDGLGGTPVFTISDSDMGNGSGNYNAGLAYYIQPVSTNVFPTATWVANSHDAVCSSVVIEPGASLDVALTPITAKAIMAGDDVHHGQGFGLSITGTPPPSVPCLVQDIVPSYLYQEYNDDDDLQAFVAAYNAYAQAFLDWFIALNLPIYTQDPVSGALLDWVAEGLYGISRPTIGVAGETQLLGPYNTIAYNTLPFNGFEVVDVAAGFVITDDIFRRIITWHFYKGDCKVFNIRWLKRRIMRFLLGVDGIDFNVDQTYQISVTFGPGNQVNINFINATSRFVSGAVYNTFGYNDPVGVYNGFSSVVTPLPPLPNQELFKQLVEGGFLELPFQFTYKVNIT